jgi:ubiquitin C-terminal hydrolase
MFGLQNFRGSCWVNTCIQAVLRIPEVQERYSKNEHDSSNFLDEALYKIWASKGEHGLKNFFESVKLDTLPAGRDIGDSHELLMYLCDKLPFLDTLCRFKIADSIMCKNCGKKELKEDSVTEYSLSSENSMTPISECILNSVKPYDIDDWKCETCKKEGCTKQQLIGTFPKVMIFHKISTHSSINYSSILGLNGKQYALLSVSCYNGSHWWSYGRNMPPGSSWYTLDDMNITEHGPKQFPVSGNMRLLIYYRLEN